MRLVLFFDLPVETANQRKGYRHFVRDIKSLGFYMLQESVYVKLSIDNHLAQSTINVIKSLVPAEGSVITLKVTEAQFCSMDYLLGDNITDVINSDERIIEL